MKDFSPLAFTSPVVGFPARLGVITLTDGTIIRLAESDQAITVSGDTYAVVPGLQVSAIKHTNNGDVPSCQIVAVHDSSNATFLSAALDAGLFDGAAVQIYNVDRLNPSRKGLWFTGAIATIAYDTNNQVTLDVKGPAVSSKILMTQTRSPMCRTDLGSVLCGVNLASFAVAATIAAIIDPFTFTVSGLTQADGYFNQGVLVVSGGAKFEIANWVLSTQTLTAYLPCDNLIEAGDAITLYPGCDKTLVNGCGKFTNQINFHGEPHYLGTAVATQQV
jgi:uncharacterized phage protein (TIGR02218 family)